MYFFDKELNQTMHDDERFTITRLTSSGNTILDLLANAKVSTEDWHGNEGPVYEIGDLTDREYTRFANMILDWYEDRKLSNKE